MVVRREGPLRVLLVSASAERGGARERTLRFFETLGDQVEVSSLCHQPSDLLQEKGVKRVRSGRHLTRLTAPIPKWFRNEAKEARDIDRWIDEAEPDLVYADGLGSMALLTHLRPRDVPLLIHDHVLPRARGLPPAPNGQEIAYHGWRGPKHRLQRPYEPGAYSRPPQSWIEAVQTLVPWWEPTFDEQATVPEEQRFDMEEAFGHPYGRIGWRVPDEPLAEFDWEAAGVENKYVILFTGRSGSTWLASLLKGLGGFGNPQEYFNPGAAEYFDTLFVGSNDAREYLEGIAREYTTDGCFGVEMTYEHFHHFSPFVDVMKVFDPADTRFVYLNRRNLLAQAFSFKAAIESGSWHSFTDGTEMRTDPSKVKLADDEVFWFLRALLKQERHIESLIETHAVQPYRISYEDLVTDVHVSLQNLTRFLGAEPPGPVVEIAQVEPETRRRFRPEVVAARLDFRSRHKQLLDEVRARRDFLNVPELDSIYARYGIDVGDPMPASLTT